MTVFEAILCGAVQGLCEFLPVSSSGHLALLHGIFGFDASGGNLLYDVLLHLGTLAAVLIAFRRDVYELFAAAKSLVGRAFRKSLRRAPLSSGEKMLVLIFASSVPLVLAVLVKDSAEALSSRPRIVGAVMIFNGVMLLLSSLFCKGEKKCVSLELPDALGIGFFQLAAALPGISRSGATVVGGTVFGLSREEAVRFSFLMSVPAIIGANVFSLADAVKDGASVEMLPCAAGVITAAVAGLAAIWLIRKIAKTKNFNIFGIYCILAGTAALIFAK